VEEDEPVVIVLDNGLIAWVSQEDEDIVDYGWKAKSAGKTYTPAYYAYFSYKIGGVQIETYLHNMIWERMMDVDDVPRGFLIDHINKDKLDNRRSNLRLATRSDNEANKGKRRGNTTSKYKGVTKINDGRKKCWRVSITVETKQVKVGTFYDEKDAARAYNEAALEQWGEFASLNDVEDKECLD
jgi:hypothetical protein